MKLTCKCTLKKQFPKGHMNYYAVRMPNTNISKIKIENYSFFFIYHFNVLNLIELKNNNSMCVSMSHCSLKASHTRTSLECTVIDLGQYDKIHSYNSITLKSSSKSNKNRFFVIQSNEIIKYWNFICAK